MAGYWPSSFLLVYVKTRRKEPGQYPAILTIVSRGVVSSTNYVITEQAWLIRDLLYGERTLFPACSLERASYIAASCSLGQPISR